MTWFRVGGAGIPASLKNAMNAVLNKKFGTSGQNYPPNGWPDDVNLLGPLPEKTVAGAIAHTDDAADTVPVKSVICSIVPKQAGSGTPSPTNVRALSGYTGLTFVQHGINFINDIQQGGIDGTNGSETQSTTHVRTGFIRVSPSTIYTCAVNSENTNMVVFQVVEYNSNDVTGFISASGKNVATTTFTTSSNTQYIRITARDTTSINISPLDLTNWQLEQGSMPSAFEAYIGVSRNDSWSTVGAILGGERNLSDGTMSSYGYLYDLGSNNWTADPNRPGVFYSNVSASGREAGSNVLGCECFETRNITVSTSYDNYISGAPSYGGAIIFIRCTDYANMTGTEVKAALTGKYACLKSSNATSYSGLSTYDFETLYAVNNFFSDIVGGQTQVTYRQDIALALAALQGSRSLSASLMRSAGPDLEERSEDPEEVSELEENIQNTEEQEGENDER